jgi:hypothetical protein
MRAVSGGYLVEIVEDPARHPGLRENLEPADTIPYCCFAYIVSPEEIKPLWSRPDTCR